MAGIIGDIQERSSTASNSAPTPPSFADQASTGFPQITHRSRVSAFKRARTQAEKPGSGFRSVDAPAVATTSSQVESRLAPQRPFVPAAAGSALDSEQILQQVQLENEAKIASMSAQERETELGELREMFGSDLLDRLRRRAEQKKAISPAENVDMTAQVGTSEPPVAETPIEEVRIGAKVQSQSKVRFAPTQPSQDSSLSSSSPLSPQAIRDKYFPDQPANLPELQWMQESQDRAPNSEFPSATRFDLSGNALNKDDVAQLPATLGLHHHGDNPTAAGYTLAEILHLCTSTFGPQRTIMLGLLSKITSRFSDYPDEVRSPLEKADLAGKTTKLGLDVLCSNERNVGVIREGISCLFHGLQAASRNETESSGRAASLPLESLLPRLERLLEEPVSSSSVAPSSIYQLLSILQNIADASVESSEEVSQILPGVVSGLITGCPWPVRDSETCHDELAIAGRTLGLVITCTQWSRGNARLLSRKGVFVELLRFIAVPPWEWTSRPITMQVGLKCVSSALQAIESANRYGLYGSVVMTTTDAIQGIGMWISRLNLVGGADVDPEATRLTIAYFSLLRTWTVCAIDPHSMEHEHDLIWSQVNGMTWADEAMDVLERVIPLLTETLGGSAPATSSDLLCLAAAACSVIHARIQGISANRVIGWQKEKESTATSLRDAGTLALVTSLLQTIQEMTHFAVGAISRDGLIPVTTALCGLLRSCDLLRPALQTTSFQLSDCLRSLADTTSGEAGQLCFNLLKVSPKTDARKWAGLAFMTLSLLQPGNEATAMQIIDDLVDLGWPDDDIKSAGHQHGFYILRPFFHYVVLPKLDKIVGPSEPVPKFLKLTTTLRNPPFSRRHGRRRMDEDSTSKLGLPLSADWFLAPIEELLKGPSSTAFKQLPPAWHASDLELARTALVFLRLARDYAEDVRGFAMTRSDTLLALMKVFMLESRPTDAKAEATRAVAREEIFRDEVVDREMRTLLKPCLEIATDPGEMALSRQPAPSSASSAAFYQLFEAFVELYEAVSFSHDTFGRLTIPPLSMEYPTDHRRLFWVDHPRTLLRSLGANKFGLEDVPLEDGDLSTFFIPHEEDGDVIRGYIGALVNGFVTPTKGEFLFSVAVWHVAHALWKEPASNDLDVMESPATDRRRQRRAIIMSLFGPSSKVDLAIVQRVLVCPMQLDPTTMFNSLPRARAGAAEILRRIDVVETLGGHDTAYKLRGMYSS